MFLFSNFLLLLYIVLVSPNSETFSEDAKLIVVANDALIATSSKSPDVLTALNTLGPKADMLFNSLIPIGSISSQNLSSESDEYKELEKLNNQTQMLWKDMDRENKKYSDEFELHPRWSSFKEMTASPLLKLTELSNKYYEPKEYKSDRVMTDLKQVCWDWNSSPRMLIKHLLFRLVRECQITLTPTDAQELAVHRVYFMQILLRLQVKNDTFPDLGRHLADFLYIREPLRLNLLERQLKSYTNQYASYEIAIDKLLNELRGRNEFGGVTLFEKAYYSSCSLRHLILSNNFNHLVVVAFASHLQNELIKLTHLAATCTTIEFKDNAEAIKQYQEEIVNDITLISTHVSQYLNNSLLSSWPSTHNGILKEQMLLNIQNTTNIDANRLKKVANITRSILDNIGLPNYAHEILIVQVPDDKYESYFNGEGTRCTFYKHNSVFNTIIGRIPLNSADQFEKLRLRNLLGKQRAAAAEVNKTIQTEMDNLYADPNLPMIAESLKKKIGKNILLDYGFNCWAIIRQWQWMPCPEIKYWSSPHKINDLESITALSYKNKGSFTQDCEDFRFFFFV